MSNKVVLPDCQGSEIATTGYGYVNCFSLLEISRGIMRETIANYLQFVNWIYNWSEIINPSRIFLPELKRGEKEIKDINEQGITAPALFAAGISTFN